MSVMTTAEPLTNLLSSIDDNLGNIDVLTGEAVLNLVNDRNFITKWDELYNACPWATIFQSHGFVASWYQHYGYQHKPILVLSQYEGCLTGLLPLAQGIKELGIAGAGGHDAYYHMWISSPAHGEIFIKSALKLLSKQFPGQDVCLKYIPENVPMSWAKQQEKLSSRCVLRSFNRPLINLSNVDKERILGRKSFREKYNRLKKLGSIEFELVTDLTSFELILDQLGDQYDFRKAATLNIMPFRDNPSKKDFLLDLFRRNILVAAVLKVNGVIISGITATTWENGWSHGAGINTHAAAYSHYSPGFLILKFLSIALKDAGVCMYDLTPGGHAYKEAHANGYDSLTELRVTNLYNALFLKHYFNIKAFLKHTFEKRGIDARKLKKELKSQLICARDKIMLIQLLPLLRISPLRAKVTHITPSNQLQTVSTIVNRDYLNDILSYNPTRGNLTRWEFMKRAVKYYEEGYIPYSFCEDNQLKHLVWLAPFNFKTHDAILQESISSLPVGSLLLCGLYSLTTARDSLTTFLNRVATTLAATFPNKNIYLIEHMDTLPLRNTRL